MMADDFYAPDGLPHEPEFDVDEEPRDMEAIKADYRRYLVECGEEPIEDVCDIMASLVGRTILAAQWLDENPPMPGQEHGWTEHEAAYLTLDDGRIVRFGGWGHDAWGATVRVDAGAFSNGEPHG
jgi:hypothetical protein